LPFCAFSALELHSFLKDVLKWNSSGVLPFSLAEEKHLCSPLLRALGKTCILSGR
jgi:hypothetical protein